MEGGEGRGVRLEKEQTTQGLPAGHGKERTVTLSQESREVAGSAAVRRIFNRDKGGNRKSSWEVISEIWGISRASGGA